MKNFPVSSVKSIGNMGETPIDEEKDFFSAK
jgi:hypothetical protein